MSAKIAVQHDSYERTSTFSKSVIREYLIAAALENMQIVRFFVETKGMDPDTTYGGKPSALCYAALKANTCLTAYLLSRGANGNRQDAMGMTPLHYATLGGSEYCVALIIRSGVSINATNYKGETPLALTNNKPHLADCSQLLQRYGGTLLNDPVCCAPPTVLH